MLQGKRFEAVQEGIYRIAGTAPTLDFLIRASRRVLPADAAISHLTNLRLRGLMIGPPMPLHFSTNSRHQVKRPGIVVHRRKAALRRTTLSGHPALGPMRTFVDAATQLNDRNLLRVGDWLVHHGQVDLLDLRAYVTQSHLDGVLRARRVAEYVGEGVESVRESDVRWVLLKAGLPMPEINVVILDDNDRQLARGDLVYRQWKVLVEYDGWQHERDARQRQWDHLRREALEAAGWRVIVVTAADMASPRSIAIRVGAALRQRGFQG